MNSSASKANRLTQTRPLLGLRILVVDDDIDIRDTLAAALEFLGATADVVAGVEPAQAELLTRGYDAILSDLAMPGSSGIDLIRWVRSHERVPLRQTHAVAVSAQCALEEQHRAVSAGFEAFLAKPFGLEGLRRVICSVLELD
jgi:CheY-like chemotaxis protein